MNPRLMVCAFLVGCSTTLAVGQETTHSPTPAREELLDELMIWEQHVDQPQLGGTGLGKIADKEWLRKQSKDLLDIIKTLYKGREADLKVLEDAQSTMSLEDQIEHRIALIKATLSEKTAKP